MIVNYVVEGESDRYVGERLLQQAGLDAGHCVVKKGTANLDPDVGKFNEAAKKSGRWLVLRDTDGKCPVELRNRLLSNVAMIQRGFMLRLAHVEVESWLMADISAFARYFGVSQDILHLDPESFQDPKERILAICKRSRLRAIREEVVEHGPDGQLRTGPLYVQHIQDFSREEWTPSEGSAHSQSLERALTRLKAWGGGTGT